MRTKQVVFMLTAIIGTIGTGAEVGDHYEESVKKHGKPIGKLVKSDKTVYLFHHNGSTAREEYNRQRICTKSDFFSAPSAVAEITESVQSPEPGPAASPKPAPKPEEPQEVVATASTTSFIVWTALALISILGGFTAIMLKRRKTNRCCIKRNRSSLTVRKNTGDADAPKSVLPTPLRSEASPKLSPNETCFFRVLQKVVQETYFITFHIDLERIIDIKSPDLNKHMSDYRKLNPVFVDFVLLDPVDTSVAAVILLRDPKTEHPYKIYRRRFLQSILREHGTPLIEIDENYEYTEERLDKTIFKTSRKNAA